MSTFEFYSHLVVYREVNEKYVQHYIDAMTSYFN